jgi:hypothetical protein
MNIVMDTDFLLSIEKQLLLINLVAFLIAMFIAVKTNKFNSTIISLGVMILFNLIMTGYTPFLVDFNKAYKSEYEHFVLLVWYLGFAGMDLMIITLILYFHHRFELKRLFCAYAVIIAYSLKMQLHIFRYLEREIFNTDHLKVVYTHGIPLINTIFASSMLAIMLILISLYFIEVMRKKLGFGEFKKGVTWYI